MNVVFLIYNRPELTARVFAEIAKVKPSKLLVVADGPKNAVKLDADKVERTRKIVEKIDWPCEVLRNYSDVNLGCKKRVSSGLDWAFGQVEEAIILEDDCLPDSSFFSFCQELLNKYRNDDRIMHIGGAYVHLGRQIEYSYYFSQYNYIWGWATWRRAWRYYDVEMKMWPRIRQEPLLKGLFSEARESAYWRKVFDNVYNGELDTWDIQWEFACWINGGLSIVPSVNLVSNIGFGVDGTHTRVKSPLAELPVGHIGEIRHCPVVVRDHACDSMAFDKVFLPGDSLLSRIRTTLGNRYFYGRLIRRCPIIGEIWEKWRRG